MPFGIATLNVIQRKGAAALASERWDRSRRRLPRVSAREFPELLLQMIDAGRWPADEAAERRQNLKPAAQGDVVRALAPEEDQVYLLAPPLRSVSYWIEPDGTFWQDFGALLEIDPDRSLLIGDFGLGSDAPIILDLRERPENPQVLRLRWGPGKETHWVSMAASFEDFVRELGL